MPGSVMKRLWPIFAAHAVRQWVDEHVYGGVVERAVVAGNAPMSYFRAGGPPMPDDGLAVGRRNERYQPAPGRHAAGNPRCRSHGPHFRAGGERQSRPRHGGHRFDAQTHVANGIFEVPDTHPKPAPARVHFRIDGAVPAAATLLSTKGMRDIVGLTLDPSTTRGTVGARVDVNLLVGKNLPKNSSSYIITADLTSFAADKLLLGRKVEASTLRVSATNDGYQVRGDVKVNGTPGADQRREEERQRSPIAFAGETR